jgi:hypothetical protein
MRKSDYEYYLRRESQERALAASAISPDIAAIHLTMAQNYGIAISGFRSSKCCPEDSAVEVSLRQIPPPALQP